MIKPTSKVIQISSCMNDNQSLTTVLCEDGSIWECYVFGKWLCILEAPKEETNNE